MCSVFGVAVSTGAPNRTTLVWRHVSYQLGKATSYVFVGLLLLLAEQWLSAEAPVLRAQNVIGGVAGFAMILVGLAYALEWRLPLTWRGHAACGMVSALWRSPSLAKSFLVGWVNGFLPCGLSLTALLLLVSDGSVYRMVGGAYVFGLATMPALLVAGLIGQKLTANRRRWMVRATGVLLVGFGVLTTVRGRPEVHSWFHRHLMKSSAAMSADHCAPDQASSPNR